MVTEAEQAALDWLDSHLHVLVCHCGAKWITAKSRKAIYHQCAPPKQRGLGPVWSREAFLAEERRAWAERQLTESPVTTALEDAVGDDALLPVD